MSRFLFKNRQTVLFIGDSITDCGRSGAQAPLGEGYAKLAVDLITARYPERTLRFINKGIGGNTVVSLLDRWEDDVIRHRPDWLSIKIGINDLARTVRDNADAVPPEHFEACYRKILERTRKATRARLILVDPFYISQDRSPDSWRGKILRMLPAYLRIVARLAREFRTLHVKTHEAFQRQLRWREADRYCPEPVHPNLSGHLVIAHEFLRAVGW
ncbi:MAG: SGNH/GDSL hydrolase family protein [Verrucomicrobiae bacterium]|nr:SGNH/GDSL hydrolase family protein [Verrucomicrobiae bacterium]